MLLVNPDRAAAVPVVNFIARQRAERVAAGLPATITDTDALSVVAALVANHAPNGGGLCEAA